MRKAVGVEERVVLDALEAAQERGHTRLIGQPAVTPRQREETVSQGPGLDERVIDEDDQRPEDANHAEVLDKPALAPDGVENAGRGAVAEAAAVASKRPLDPHQRDAEQEQRDQVWNHERPATIDGRLGGKTQKISQPHRRAGDRHDDRQPRTPVLARLAHNGQPSSAGALDAPQ